MAEQVKLISRLGEPEPRWPSILALLAVGVMYLTLPERLTPGPNWLVLVVVSVLLVPATLTHSMGNSQLAHKLGLVLSGMVTIALVWSVEELIRGLPENQDSGSRLLMSASSLWTTTVLVFASWYWRLDAGGPHARHQRGKHEEGAFLFPQMTMKPPPKDWRPGFVDYLFLAFTTSTSFAPSDTPPLTRWAKMLMMLQSGLSLSTIAVLAGRAVNTIGGQGS